MFRILAVFWLGALLATLGCAPEEETPAAAPKVFIEPPWLRHFDSVSDQFLFDLAVRRYFLERGRVVELGPDGRFRATDGSGQTWNVEALAEFVARADPAQWDTIVADHFDGLEALAARAQTIELPADWAEARAHLRVQIYPAEFPSAGGPGAAVVRTDLPGLATCLVFDREDAAVLVSASDLERWGQDAAAAFAVAEANTREHLRGRIEVNEREFEDVGELEVLTSDAFYAATAVLWLDDLEELAPDSGKIAGRHGAIVSVPWRNGVFVWPFDDLRVQTLVPALYRYGQRIVEGGAGPIAPDVYWWRPGAGFLAIPIEELEDGRLEVEPPRELAELLRTLRKGPR